MIRDGQELLAQLMDGVGYQAADKDDRPLHPLIIKHNQIASKPEYMVDLILGELDELAQEHEYQPFSLEWWFELADKIVTLKSARDRFAPTFSIREITPAVNGQWKGDFRSLREQVGNLTEGNPHRNFQHIITELLSMLKHLDVGIQSKVYLRLSSLIAKLNDKLEKNKESKYCQIEPGMNDADVYNKTIHVFLAFRKIRKFLKEVVGQEQMLQPWITAFFEAEIMDWRHSEQALARIDQKLPLLRANMRDSLAWLLSAQPDGKSKKQLTLTVHQTQLQHGVLHGNLPKKSQQKLELQLMIAGAVPLSTASPEKTAAAGVKTFFWV